MKNHSFKIGFGIMAALVLLLARNAGVITLGQSNPKSISFLKTQPNTKPVTLQKSRNLPLNSSLEPPSSRPASPPESYPSLRVQFASLAAKNVAVKEQFEKLIRILPAHQASELVAIYGAQVLGRSSSDEFRAFYSTMMTEIWLESPRVYEVLETAADQLRELPFEHQVLLNLAADLNVSPREKARLMGPSLAQKFEVSPTNEISDGSACVTIALIQMQKANVAFQDIALFARRGLELTSDDLRSSGEFRTRILTYYHDAAL